MTALRWYSEIQQYALHVVAAWAPSVLVMVLVYYIILYYATVITIIIIISIIIVVFIANFTVLHSYSISTSTTPV